MKNEIQAYLSPLSAETRAAIARGNWDETMTDPLYIAVGATTADEMRTARSTAEKLAKVFDSTCECSRTMDSAEGPGHPARKASAFFWKGETYACRSGTDGQVRVLDRNGTIHYLPNAGFDRFFNWTK